jgi:hypothetical protein
VLFGYPNAANASNWLHDCIYEILKNIHLALNQGVQPLSWPDCIPATHREKLKSRRGLRNRINVYKETLENLRPAERQEVYNALIDQNKIPTLLSATSNCKKIDELPEGIREKISDIYDVAFDLLTDLGIRDKQYKAIYDSIPRKDCPFCGLEPLDAPGAHREDLDHYLARTIYPFAAANLANLVPMGMKCNQRYKKANNVLFAPSGARRKAVHPFTTTGTRIVLINSEPFAGDAGLPRWEITFDPYAQEYDTWDQVFDLKKRYQRDVLDTVFAAWVKDFAALFSRKFPGEVPTNQQLVSALLDYIGLLQTFTSSGREFLRPALFEMLLHKCQQGDQRLITFLNETIRGLHRKAA